MCLYVELCDNVIRAFSTVGHGQTQQGIHVFHSQKSYNAQSVVTMKQHPSISTSSYNEKKPIAFNHFDGLSTISGEI